MAPTTRECLDTNELHTLGAISDLLTECSHRKHLTFCLSGGFCNCVNAN
jgi:hypothetical protein